MVIRSSIWQQRTIRRKTNQGAKVSGTIEVKQAASRACKSDRVRRSEAAEGLSGAVLVRLSWPREGQFAGQWRAKRRNPRRCAGVSFAKAERTGFEPAVGFDPYNGLANRRLQPLGHLSSQHANLRSSAPKGKGGALPIPTSTSSGSPRPGEGSASPGRSGPR